MAQELLTDKETLKESCIILSLIKTIFSKLGLSRGLSKKQQVLEINLSDINSKILCFRKVSLVKDNSDEEIQIKTTDLMVTTQTGWLS